MVKSSSEDAPQLLKSSLRVLRAQFGKSFKLPSSSQLPTYIALPQGAFSASRADQKHAQLESLVCAYALYLLIEGSTNPRAYYAALRNHHKIKRENGDPIMLLVRSVRGLAPQAPAEARRITQSCSEWATAIRYCARKSVEPHKVVGSGMRAGQGISAWAKKQRSWRQQMERDEAGLDPQSRAKIKRKGRSVTELSARMFRTADDRLLLEVGPTSANSSRVRVYSWKKLKPEKLKARKARWKRISKAADQNGQM
jgi:hypothetical protein